MILRKKGRKKERRRMASESQQVSTPSIPIRSETEIRALHEEWLIKQNKSYESEEEKEKRFKIFKDNLKRIEEHNAGNHSYTMGLNQFSDLTHEEFRSTFLGLKLPPAEEQCHHSVEDHEEEEGEGEGDLPPKVGLVNKETSA